MLSLIEIDNLQRQLALIDLFTEHRSGSTLGNSEFLVIKLQNIKIKMYQEQGHKTPHIHIDYGREAHIASYAINPPKRLAGNLQNKYDKEILPWAEKNKDVLLNLWEEVQSGNDPELIWASISGNA